MFLKQVICDRPVSKMKRHSSITLNVSLKNPISRKKLKITSTKIQTFIEAIRFQNGFHDKSAKSDLSKEMLVPILKGLKHLNTVFKI